MRYQWKDLSLLILLVTILIAFKNGKLNGFRKDHMHGFIWTKNNQSRCQKVKDQFGCGSGFFWPSNTQPNKSYRALWIFIVLIIIWWCFCLSYTDNSLRTSLTFSPERSKWDQHLQLTAQSEMLSIPVFFIEKFPAAHFGTP